MSERGSYPPGVSAAHPHFYDAEEPTITNSDRMDYISDSVDEHAIGGLLLTRRKVGAFWVHHLSIDRDVGPFERAAAFEYVLRYESETIDDALRARYYEEAPHDTDR